MTLDLPHGENRARRVLNYGHSAEGKHIERRLEDLGSELLGPRGGIVGTVHAHIQTPVGWHGLVSDRKTPSGVFSVDLEHGVVAVGSHRIVDGFPTEQVTVELLGGGLIGGSEFQPAERSRGMLFDVGHESILPFACHLEIRFSESDLDQASGQNPHRNSSLVTAFDLVEHLIDFASGEARLAPNLRPSNALAELDAGSLASPDPGAKPEDAYLHNEYI